MSLPVHAQWPSRVKFPTGQSLVHSLDADGNDVFSLRDAGWPHFEIPSALPLLVVMVCAVGVHRGELRLKDRKETNATVPGYEFSGYVVSTSPRSPYPPGTEVYGRTSFERLGNARKYIVAKFNEVAPKPVSMTWEEAATVPLGGLVAFQALFNYRLLRQPIYADWDTAALLKGHNRPKSLLITGAATPAGVWAVQLAKRAGVGKITATCHADQMDLVRELGAHEVYDWAGKGNLSGWDKGMFSAVLDCMGGETLARAWRLVGPNGKIISVVTDAGQYRPAIADPSIEHFNFILTNCRHQLNILQMLSDRRLAKAVCDPQDIFDFADYQAAIKRLRGNQSGHVVLKQCSLPPHPLIYDLRQRQADRWADLEDFTPFTLHRSKEEDVPEKIDHLAKWVNVDDYPQLTPPRTPVPSKMGLQLPPPLGSES